MNPEQPTQPPLSAIETTKNKLSSLEWRQDIRDVLKDIHEAKAVSKEMSGVGPFLATSAVVDELEVLKISFV